MDRYELYEYCVQTPDDMVPLLWAFHGNNPSVLGEDFCGSASLSSSWITNVPDGKAIATDHDAEAVAHITPADDLTIINKDVITGTDGRNHAADVIYCGNFSIGERQTRADLLAYLRHVRGRLNDGGIFVCDVYGGKTAFIEGRVEVEYPGPAGEVISYTWEQREANPVTALVVNALHFKVFANDDANEPDVEFRDAFVYHWRLWGVAELRDAMIEAGFEQTQAFPRVPEAKDDDDNVYVAAIEDGSQLNESYDVLIVARMS